ncbi:MAG: ACT domain-containing protein, partial [Clostridia bacterium]|nr:ACT domain-containing protein [Clostridia bacterium]
MLTKQISVFLENRGGRLSEVLSVLKASGVNILSLSLADTSDYGLLRIIVDDSEKGKQALSAQGFSAKVSMVT